MIKKKYTLILSNIPLVSILLVFATLIPKNIAYIFIPCILVFILIQNYKNIFNLILVKILLMVSIFLSILNTMVIDQSPLSFRYFPFLFILLLYPYKNISTKYLSNVAVIIIVFLFITQILLALDIEYVVSIRDSLYPIKNDIWKIPVEKLSTLEFSRTLRYGGIYYNPNVIGHVYVFLILIVFVSRMNLKLKILMLIIVFIGVLLTGSRSAIMIYFFIVLLYLNSIYTNKTIKNIILFLIISILAINIILGSSNLLESIQQGIFDPNGSFAVKVYILINYFEKIDSIRSLLLGDTFSGVMFDTDIGDIIGHFGLLGLISVLSFIILVGKKTIKKNRYMLLIFLFMLTNTLFYNFQASLLLFILLVFVFDEQRIQCNNYLNKKLEKRKTK